MDFERELNQMIDAMTERVGQRPSRIMMHPDTAQVMAPFSYMHFNDLAEAEGYVAQYNGTPIILSTNVEPNKFYLVQDSLRFEPYVLPEEGTYNTYWWMRSPHGNPCATMYGSPQWWQTHSPSFTFDTYREQQQSEEPDEIDESSFIDILKAGEQGGS